MRPSWLHVDVAGAFLHCFGQDHVDQLDDRRLVGRLLQLVHRDLFLFGLHLQSGVVIELLGDLLQLVVRASVKLFQCFLDGRLRGHHRLDVEAGHELDVVHGEHVGGIHHGDGQRRGHPAQRQHLVAARRFLRDQLDDRGVHLEVGEVDGRNAVLPGQEGGDILVRHEAEFHQAAPQSPPGLLLLVQSASQLFLRKNSFFYEELTDTC